MLLNLEIETAAREVIADGLEKISCLRDVEAAVRTDADALDLDFAKLVDIEVRAAAGLFFGLCRSLDVEQFPKTFQFCLELLEALSAEYERRRSIADAH